MVKKSVPIGIWKGTIKNKRGMERPYSCSIFADLHNITLWTAPRLEHFDISKEEIQLNFVVSYAGGRLS